MTAMLRLYAVSVGRQLPRRQGPVPERRLLCRVIVRRHHEAAATALVSALAMVIPVAGGLWARLVSIRAGTQPPEKPAEADHDREG